MTLLDYYMTNYNSDELKKFVDLCGGSSRITRKAERAEFLEKTLTSASEVQRLWNAMDDLSRKAVAAAYHNDGVFDTDAFVAQYGSMPTHPKRDRWSYYGDPIIMDLFIQNRTIIPLLMPMLAPIVPPLERFQLSGAESAPTDVEVGGDMVACIIALREDAGRHDLLLFLSLMAQGALKLSNTSLRLTPKSVGVLMAGLTAGDFVADAEKVDDTVICFGLCNFAEQVGFTKRHGGLTDAGKRYLATEDLALLLQAFETWSEEGNFDEITRIDAIRGLRARGIRLTPPAERRQRIVEALSWCPTGVWIPIHDFYRALKIWHFDFHIEQGGPDKLYVGYARSNRYEEWAPSQSQWLLTNGLYINAVLWETLASIGALDIAYVDDVESTGEVVMAETYDYDELTYSRYDGLTHFRINPLGAYLFGQAHAYTSLQPTDAALFSVGAEGRITLLKPDDLSVAHHTQLEQIADATGDGYQLSVQKLLTILETVPDLDLSRSFLEQRNRGPLPDEINAFFKRVQADSKALRIQNKALTIRVQSAELAQAVLDDASAGKIARRLDERTLLIYANKENAFRNALRKMGYGLSES